MVGIIAFGVLISYPLGLECRYLPEKCGVNPTLVARAMSLLDIRTGIASDLTSWWRVVEIAFRLFVVVQTALLVLALRNRIKRN
jgi:hypothetical protein